MPNTNEFHLYIHLDELTEESAMAGGGSRSSTEQKDSGTAKGIQSAAKKLVSYSVMKSTAEQVISGHLSQVELTTGASEYEARLQAGYNVGKQIFGAGEKIAIGAMTGGVWGALAGLVISGVQWGISYGQQRRALAKQESLEDASISFLSVRAGTAGRRGREQ